MTRSSLLAPVLLLSVLAPTAALASPVNPWGATVGKGVVALTPFLYVDQTPAAYPYLYAQYGFTDSFEILAGGGGTIAEAGSSVDELELMPRLFVSDSAGLALHATYTPGVDGVTLAPEYHGVYSWDPLDLTVNVGWGPWVGKGGFALGDVYAQIAPERYLVPTRKPLSPAWAPAGEPGAPYCRRAVAPCGLPATVSERGTAPRQPFHGQGCARGRTDPRWSRGDDQDRRRLRQVVLAPATRNRLKASTLDLT
ncbi:hypothetical protein L6R53_31715 [Myxococcota bacterium]|nr:hypothetical protein [Myxococcota bacterium]